jgi:putative SOS response-associated peptidase YedK
MPLEFAAWNGPLTPPALSMCNLYSITTNQAAIIALFRVMNRYVGNLPPMPGVFSRLSRADNQERRRRTRADHTMRWGMPPPPRAGRHIAAAMYFNVRAEGQGR